MQFRKSATRVVEELTIKGFAMDDELRGPHPQEDDVTRNRQPKIVADFRPGSVLPCGPDWCRFRRQACCHVAATNRENNEEGRG